MGKLSGPSFREKSSGPSFGDKFLSKLFEAEEEGEGDRDGWFVLVKDDLLPRLVFFLWTASFLLRGIVGIILLCS